MTTLQKGSNQPDEQEDTISASAGDVLFSWYALPVPDAILQRSSSTSEPSGSDVRVSFEALQSLLEFLEFVVLTERLIVPVSEFTPTTQLMLDDDVLSTELNAYRLPGALDFKTEEILSRLSGAGVLHEATLKIGEPTADSLIAQFLPTSKSLQAQHAEFRKYSWGDDRVSGDEMAMAKLAVWIGAPLHVAEAAALSRTPFVLGRFELKFLSEFERENIRSRKAIGAFLLDRLNASARKELSRLDELGVPMSFPETPIASLILHNSSSPSEMVDVALGLRDECATFRHQLNEIERDLADEDQSLKTRLKRMRELENLAKSLWPEKQTDLRTTAVGLADALLALPELAGSPTPLAIKKVIDQLGKAPLEKIAAAFRRRRIRLFLKARRRFLNDRDATKRIARILDVSEETVKRSRSRSHR